MNRKIERKAIRKFIFRKEIEILFKKNGLNDKEQYVIINELFENSDDAVKQLILKEELNNLEELSLKMKKLDSEKRFGRFGPEFIKLMVIDDDLHLNKELRKIVRQNNNIAIFVGAGVSKLIELPLWNEFADKSIKYLYDINVINYFEYKRIIQDVNSPKQKLTIFHDFISKIDERAMEFYKHNLTAKKDLENNPYKLLAKLDVLKITSNIDNEYFNALNLEREILSVSEDRKRTGFDDREDVKGETYERVCYGFNSETKLNNKKLYQIHGCINKLDSTVMTTKDYLDKYYRTDELKGFLETVFKTYTVIFIGSGLDEFEILEHCFSMVSQRHYVLLPSYLYEVDLFRVIRKYFANLNIVPIRYYLDFNGHDRLYTVLEYWVDEIRKIKKDSYYEKIKDMGDI